MLKPSDMDKRHLINTVQKANMPKERVAECLMRLRTFYNQDYTLVDGHCQVHSDPESRYIYDKRVFTGIGEYDNLYPHADRYSDFVPEEICLINSKTISGETFIGWVDSDDVEFNIDKVLETHFKDSDKIVKPKEEQKTKKTKTKGKNMKNNTNALTDIQNETIQNTELIIGERIYENIETFIEDYALNKLTWWQKLTFSKKQKELAILVGVYGLIHFIKSGGFGLTNYQVDHKVLDLITLACNHKIQTKMFSGIDTNMIQYILTKPVITEV